MKSTKLDPLIKNEFSKHTLHTLGLRRPFAEQVKTKHYRLPALEANGGFLVLNKYQGVEINKKEWEALEYVTYPTDPNTWFAPLTSADGAIKMEGFWEHNKADRDGIWTANAKKAPQLRKWVESIGANYGRVQLLRMSSCSLRETRWGLHLDDNNRLNKTSDGWVVRLWLELTDDNNSYLVLRRNQFDRKNEVKIALPRFQQIVVDSEYLFHGAWHTGKKPRYALIVSFESGPALEKWLKTQLPKEQPQPAPWLH